MHSKFDIKDNKGINKIAIIIIVIIGVAILGLGIAFFLITRKSNATTS